MIYVFYGVFILACVVLILAVLLQPGKADAGALFSGSVNSTAFGARGTATLLAKITVGAAASFFLIALLMSQPALTGQRSTLDSTPDTGGAVPAPTVVPPAPAQPPGAPAPGTTAPVAAPADQKAPATTASPAASPAGAPVASPAKAPAGKPAAPKPNGK